MIASSKRQQQRRSKPKRKSQGRSEKIRVLIVCEGKKTEPQYFVQLSREDNVRKQFTITVYPGTGGSRIQIVQRAVDKKNDKGKKYDEVYCVMDTERLDNPETLKDFRDAVKLADDHKIDLYLSNPAFEVWFLAHFKRTCKTFSDCDAVISELNKNWRQAFKSNYEKNDPRIFQKLKSKLNDAIKNAKAVLAEDHGGKHDVADCNSSTEIYFLIETLYSTKKKSKTNSA